MICAARQGWRKQLLIGGCLGLLFAAAAGLALLWMAWLSTRGVRERDPVLRAWHRLGGRYARLGLARAPDEPALAWAERVSQSRPELGAALRPLSQRFSDWRYASGRGTPPDDRALARALRAHRPTPTSPHGDRP